MSVDKKVPEIRFKGFSEAWDKYPLATFISTLDAGVSVNSGDRPANENEFGILKTSCVTNGFFEPNENKVVFKTEEISRLKEPVLENTIIISRMNTPALVGANAYISKSYANYFLPDRLWAAKPSSIGDLKFIAYILGSDKGRRALSDLATGTSGSMKNISKPAVLELEFRTPAEEKEQIQIGNYFQKLDTLINQHQQKHDKLSSIKKAMLEKMFPKQGETMPEIRFKGFSAEWRKKKLGDVTDITMGQSPSGENYTDNPNDYILVQGNADLKNGFVVPRVWTSEVTKTATKGALIFSVRAPVGEVGKTNYDVVLGRGVAAIYGNEFIYQQLKKLKSVNYWYTVSAGSTFEAISSSELASTFIWVSSESEQEKVGDYFQKLDALINQHQQQITKLNNIKQACLSKMFV